mgnify:FL=1
MDNTELNKIQPFCDLRTLLFEVKKLGKNHPFWAGFLDKKNPFSFLAHLSPKKPPRPISAVPSEYSDISTSSCRTSDDGESDEKSLVKTTGDESSEPVRISIVVKKENSEVSEDPHALAMSRVFRVASELLSTEEQYVTVLYLIDQVNIHTID